MLKVEKLRAVAIRYCMDNYIYWFDKYKNQNAPNGHSLFPRYLVLEAILQKLQMNIDLPASTVEECLSELISIGNNAQSDSINNIKSEIGIEAINDERKKFIEYISNVQEDQLNKVLPLPYDRKLNVDESMTIREKFKHIWAFGGGYWNPLTDDYKGETLFLMVCDMKKEDKEKIVHFLTIGSEKRFFTIDDMGNDFETEIIEFESVEVAYTNKSFEWILYFSHEGTVTFGGTNLINYIKTLFSNRTNKINKSAF
jgi:hypothetical protein